MLRLILIVNVLCLVVSLQRFNKIEILKPFHQRKALKIISGLRNTDAVNVGNVAWAASNGGATLIDIACKPELVRMVKSFSTIPVCVSSIYPEEFMEAVRAGADMVEIGNFDGFYPDGMDFPADEVVRMVQETRRLVPGIPMSVTVPHTLSMSDQVSLAQHLQHIGADIIQTEGKVRAATNNKGVDIVADMIDRATPTLTATQAISRAVRIPVMSASGLTEVTAPLALAAGAWGIGIGSMVSQLDSREGMLAAVQSIALGIRRTWEDVRTSNSNGNVNSADANTHTDLNSALAGKLMSATNW